MILALSETRLVFYSHGLAATGWAVAIGGSVVFALLLVHGLVRARAWALRSLLAGGAAVAGLAGWLWGRDAGALGFGLSGGLGGMLGLVCLVRRFNRRPALLQEDAPRGSPAPLRAGEEAGESSPQGVLPWWQIAVGLVLAGILAWASAAAGRSDPSVPPLVLALLVAGVCGTWTVFFYLPAAILARPGAARHGPGMTEPGGRLPAAALLAMRIAAILILIVLIFKPTLSFDQRSARRMDLDILVDTSRSMSVSDWPDSPNRMALAAKQVEEYLDRLRSTFRVRWYWFDSRVREARPGEWPEPKGDATNLARAVKDVLATATRADTAAIILMSDGLDNAGGNVVREVAAIGPPPIDTVGVGTDLSEASGFQDIRLADVRAPEECTVNNLTKISVDVEAVGLADRSVTVELREGESLVASAPLRLEGTGQRQNVTLTVTPTEVGPHTYKVYIRPDPAERLTENNERELHLLVTDPKIRILYIEGVVRPEYKPLKSVLETDPNVELAAMVQVKRGEFLQSGNLKDVAPAGFPKTLEAMRRFDVFILGDLDRSYFSNAQLENLKTAVGEGRGLVMLGGYNSFGPGGYEGTPLEAILPVSVGPRSMGQETTPFVLKLTPEGTHHPIFQGTQEFFQASSSAPQERLPLLKGCNILGRARPGASVLAVHPQRTNEGQPLIVLAVQTYGSGRTAAFAADTTYQWYLPYRALGRESPYIKFWSQMVRWLASKEIKEQSTKPGVDLVVLKPFYQPGEKVLLRAKVRADEGRATNFATVTGVLLGPEGERKPLALALRPEGGGVYETELDPPDPGAYRAMVEARKDDRPIGTADVRFTVGRPNQEFDRLGIDRALLKNLAQATGGAYYEPANFGDLVERLRGLVTSENVHRELGVQTVPGLFGILFGAFLALVTGEWVLRKYYQLH